MQALVRQLIANGFDINEEELKKEFASRDTIQQTLKKALQSLVNILPYMRMREKTTQEEKVKDYALAIAKTAEESDMTVRALHEYHLACFNGSDDKARFKNFARAFYIEPQELRKTFGKLCTPPQSDAEIFLGAFTYAGALEVLSSNLSLEQAFDAYQNTPEEKRYDKDLIKYLNQNAGQSLGFLEGLLLTAAEKIRTRFEYDQFGKFSQYIDPENYQAFLEHYPKETLAESLKIRPEELDKQLQSHGYKKVKPNKNSRILEVNSHYKPNELLRCFSYLEELSSTRKKLCTHSGLPTYSNLHDENIPEDKNIPGISNEQSTDSDSEESLFLFMK